MSKIGKGFLYVLALIIVVLAVLYVTSAIKAGQSKNNNEQAPTNLNENEVNVYLNQTYGDQWYGPGFYFGLWFTSIYAYQTWRYNHRDYPSNRHYYNHDHPVHYHGHDHGERHNEGGQGGHGGEHGGGGHGGGHGGGGHGGGGHK